MMGVRTPETCWALHKRQVINFSNCCIQLVDLFELYDDARNYKLCNSYPFTFPPPLTSLRNFNSADIEFNNIFLLHNPKFHFPVKLREGFTTFIKFQHAPFPYLRFSRSAPSHHITLLPWYRSISKIFLHIHHVLIILHHFLADSNIKPVTSSHINYGPCNYVVILRKSSRWAIITYCAGAD